VWLHEESTPFDSAEQLTEYLEAVCLRQSIGALPPDQRERLLADVVDAMPERVIDYVRLNIVVRRGG
jgi:DNA-directed RNA polymerase specialized sigma24 family protein